MPIKRCMIDKQSGYKWGDEGTCYPGKGGKVKAAKQGIAAANNGYKMPKEEYAKLMTIVKGRK